MNKSKWVQHISGQGEKWEIHGETYDSDGCAIDWQVNAKKRERHALPAKVGIRALRSA